MSREIMCRSIKMEIRVMEDRQGATEVVWVGKGRSAEGAGEGQRKDG